MKRRDAMLALSIGGVVLLALLSVFAIELSNTQAKSKADVTSRVHERGVLAAALIDSLFGTVTAQIPQDQARYGGARVSPQVLEHYRATNPYLAVLDSHGRVLAASSGFTAQARAELAGSAALALVRAGHPYGLGDALPYTGGTTVIDLATAFPSPYGQRILVSGLSPKSLGPFLQGDLRQIPGVSGAHNYVLDARNSVLASTNPLDPAGKVFNQPAQIRALDHLSGDNNGHYYVQVPISNATWRLLLSSPNGPLFASVSGLRKWVPWMIFAAFALVALLALALGRRTLGAAARVHEANAQLGDLNGRLGEANDALERRAAELARSNNELEQFASIASHDLQEPLRKVRTFTQQVIDREADGLSERGQDYLQRASGAAERMQRLIEDLLRFSRVSTQGRPFAPVDLDELAAEVLSDLETAVADSEATVHVGSLPTVNGDIGQLRALLQNLVSNALKFRRPGVPCEVEVDAEVRDEQASLTVRDNGIGFDPRYERRIFRVFERLHNRTDYPGTGIGLALCRKIAERHGGTITAHSVPGEGATFTVTLPLHQVHEVLLSAPPLDAADFEAPAPKESYVAV